MAFEDSLIGNSDFDPSVATQDLIRQVSDEPLPANLEIRDLNTRLARKINAKPPKAEEPPEEKSPKQPLDTSDLEPAEPEQTAQPTSAGLDISDLEPLTPPTAPAAPPSPGILQSIHNAINPLTAIKGVTQGAVSGIGGMVQGAGTVLAGGLGTQAPEGNEFAAQPVPTDASGRITTPAAAVAASPLVSGGKAIKAAGETIAPMTDQEKASVLGRGSMMAGGILPYVVAGAAGGTALGMAAGFTGMAADTYGSVYEDAKKKGASDDQAATSAGRSALVAGVLGATPLGAGALNKIPGIAKKTAGTAFDKWINSLLGKVVDSTVAFAGAGEAQEAILQQIAKDYDPKAGYTFDQKRLIAEIILGAGMGGLHHAMEPPQPAAAQPNAGAGAGAQPAGAIPPGGPQPNAGAGPGAGTPPPGPQPGAAPRPGPPPGDTKTQAEHPEKGPDFTLDPQTRAKMERVMRTIDPGSDPSAMSDADLFNTLQNHLREGSKAAPETEEEVAAREQAATDRTEREALKRRGWTDAHINAMSPEQRRKYFQDAMAGEQRPPPGEKPSPQGAPEQPESTAAAPSDQDIQDELLKGGLDAATIRNLSPEDRKAYYDSMQQARAAKSAAPRQEPPESAGPTPSGHRDEPITPRTADDVVAAQPAEPKSTAQAQAENFQHAHVDLPQFNLTGSRNISVETGVGQERKGIGPDGKEWSVTMEHGAYGRLKGTKGADGQPLDAFIGPHPTSPHVFVIDQHDPKTGLFDEHKLMLGYRTPIDALHAYANSYDDLAKDRIGHVTAMGPEEFKGWLKGDTTKPLKPSNAEKTDEILPPETTPRPAPQPVSTEPVNLLQFIVQHGGLKTRNVKYGPELLGMDAHKHIVAMPKGHKGFPALVNNKRGLPPDEMADLAQQHFYWPKDAKIGGDDLIEAVREGIAKKHRYPETQERTKTKRDLALEANREQHDQARDEASYGPARNAIKEAGHADLPQVVLERAARLMADHGETDPDTAVDHAIMQLDAEQGETPEQIDDILGAGAYDEIKPAAAHETGRHHAPAREQSARPGEEGAAAGTGERTPGAGEEGAHGRPAGTAEHTAAGRERAAGRSETTGDQTGNAAPDRAAAAAANAAEARGVKANAENAKDQAKPAQDTIRGKRVIGYKEAYRLLDTGQLKQRRDRAGQCYKWGVKTAIKLDADYVIGIVNVDKSPVYHGVVEVTEGGKRFIHDPTLEGDHFLTEDDFSKIVGGWHPVHRMTGVEANRFGIKNGYFPDPATLKLPPIVNALERGPMESEREAERDAPTWAEILAQLPMHKDGRTRQHEIAFEAMKKIAGKTKYSDLTPAQKHELLKAVTPKPTTTEKTEAGEQTVLPGAEKESQGTQAQRKAEQPLKPKVAQKPADVGLFGDEKDQGDLMDLANKKPAEPAKPPEKSVSDIFDDVMGEEFGNKPAPEDETVAALQARLPPGYTAMRPADFPQYLRVEGPGGYGIESKDPDDIVKDVRRQVKKAKRPEAPFSRAAMTTPKPTAGMGLDAVAKGLKGIFGTKPPGFSEAEEPFSDDTYKLALPFLKAGAEHFAGNGDVTDMVRNLVRHLTSAAGMEPDAIRAMKPYIVRFVEDVRSGKESINAPSRSDLLEPDSGEPEARDTVGKANVPAAAGATGQGAGAGRKASGGRRGRSRGGERVSQDHAPAVGEDGNLELPAREPDVEGGDTAAGERERGADNGEEGLSPDRTSDEETIRHAQAQADVNARRERQREAEGAKVIPGDISNIAETLPMLFPEQHDDVLKAEQRYAKPDGHGMLFTNGTGTGKTYSGLGVIKRLSMQGKNNTLVVAPSQGILMDWVKSAKDLGLDLHVLKDTMDKGEGISATTYANLGANRHLADRDWDMVVADEAHKLSSDKDGTTTEALKTFRALTNHPDGLFDRSRMVLRDDWDRIDKMPEGDARDRAYLDVQKKSEPLIDKWRNEPRPKVLMMSATPFAYHFSLDYGEGYLFNYDRERTGTGYNSGSGRDRFFMQHLGYRMRTNRLTKPDADVRAEIMERQLHEYLKQQGSLSGRALTVDKDYDRKFVLAHDAVGNLIDQAMTFLQEAEDGKYRPLYDIISKRFDYLTRMRLLEAMKAQSAIPFIRQSLALKRKVVVFHDYNEGGGISPFLLSLDPSETTTVYQNGEHVEVNPSELYKEFVQKNPYVEHMDFSKYPAPIHALTAAFPDALVYNGTVSNKARNEAKRLFNDDDSGRNIIIVQSAAGEAGISLHDTTGKRQRTLLNLGMPIRPTTSIQQEGRIYRVGQASDAIFRYMNTGTDWERWTFAGKIAERAGTAENLALGDQARTIRQSFVDAFSNSGDYAPEIGEGKGGKEADRAISHSVSEFDKAKTHYFANAKTSGRRDQREGTDYYATPEPIGLKMVEFADIKPGEKVLEPSAGHGAISRYFPEDTARTLVEPSTSLASRAALTSPGARVVVDRFENLDPGANKFDAIIMNPPFGTGGKTAIEHLAKAAKHLRNGGRIVALIPHGPAADKRFDEFMDDSSGSAKGLYLVGDIKMPSVTFERAGTAINTRIVVLEKQLDAHVATQLQQKNRDYSDVEKIGDLFDRIENADMGQRLEPATKEADIPTSGKMTVDGIELSVHSDGDKHYVSLEKYIGSERFRALAKNAERNGGHYMKAAKMFSFPSTEARQQFLNEIANPPPETAEPSGVTFKTGETTHAKTGAKLFVATADRRLDPDAYADVNRRAKEFGGYYSSYDKMGAIPGFQFKSEADRQKFLDAMAGKPGGFAENPNAPKPWERANLQPGAKGAEGQAHVLQKGRASGNEHLIAYDANGKEIHRTSGTSKTVAVTPEFQKVMTDPASDIVVHHNHPSGTTLSIPDVQMLGMPGLSAVWAHGHNGNVYRGALTPEAKKYLPADPIERARKLQSICNAIDFDLFPPIERAVQNDQISVDEGNRNFHELRNRVLNVAGILDYRTNADLGDFVERVPGLLEKLKDVIELAGRQITPQGEDFNEQRAINRANARRSQPLRHAGELGATFEKARSAPAVSAETGPALPRPAPDRVEEAGSDRGVGGDQLRLLDNQAAPETTFSLGAFGSPDQVIKSAKAFWTSTFQPELVSDKALLADPVMARYKAAQAHEKDAIIRASENEWNYWNKRGDPERIRFLDDVETAGFGAVPPDPVQARMAKRYRAMLDANWQLEKLYGSKAAFVEDYFPHIWERPDDWRAFAEARSAQMGPTWFQKKRTIDYITDGLAAGLKLKYTNPVDIIVHRLSSGVDMRQRMEMLYQLKDQGLAWEGVQGGAQLVRRGWRAINAPDRKQWVIHPDIQPLWKNAVEAKGLWQAEHLGGSMFRGWMALKNAWVPVKLAMSAFHPLHVLHINYSNGMALGWDQVVKGKDPIGALKTVAEGFYGPLQAAPGATAGAIAGTVLGTGVGMPVWGGIAGSMAGAATYGALRRAGIVSEVPHPGKTARKAWQTKPSLQTADQKAMVALMTDGGFVPQLSEQMKIGAKRQLAVAFQKALRKEAGPRDWRRMVTATMRRGIEKLQAPIFEQWIPNLKAAAYLNQTAALLKRRPELLTYHNDRRVALRAIAKSIDNRFGEMFYGGLFWNRYLKDSAIGSFLSLGWNLGFVREFGGAAMETVTRPLGLLPPLKPGASRRDIRNATNKIAFAIAYMASSALILGMMSMLMDDEHKAPEGLDFIFPRIGGVNPDGSPRRVTNMSYIREIPMLLKHIQERGGDWLTGTAELLWNKLMFEPFSELLNNRDYYGYNIWDENAPKYQQIWQGLRHTFGDQNPMALSGAKHAADLSGKPLPSASEAIEHPDRLIEALRAKGVDMSFLGFGPAPAYVEKSSIQNRISYLYGRHVAPEARPFAQSEHANEKMSIRTAMMIAKRDHDSDALEAARERGKAIGLTSKYMNKIGSTPTDIYLFSRLPVEDQKSILNQASPEEKQRYIRHANKSIRWESNGASP